MVTASLAAVSESAVATPSIPEIPGIRDPALLDLSEYEPDDDVRVIVEVDPPVTAAVDRHVDEIGPIDVTYRYRHLHAYAATMTRTQAEKVAGQRDVRSISLDRAMRAHLDTATEEFGPREAVADFGVDGDAANNGATNYTNDDIVIAVLDTGIDDGHRNLDGNKVIAFHDVIGNIFPICDAPPGGAYDDNGHGTHVASIAAGHQDWGSGDYDGVAPHAALVGVKVLDCDGFGFTSEIDEGIEWVIDNRAVHGIDVLNLSLGTTTNGAGTDSTSKLVNKAVAAGIASFVAAGNQGPGDGSVGIPAVARWATTVGAMADPRDGDTTYAPGFGLAPFSSWGPTTDGRIKPDIAAAGVDIRAAQTETLSGLTTLSGTSMATPFAAGVAALLLEADPSLAPSGTACACPNGVQDSTMRTPVRDLLEDSAQDWGPSGKDNHYGSGRLDAHEAVRRAIGAGATSGPAVPRHEVAKMSLSAGQEHLWVLTEDLAWPLVATLIIDDSADDFDLRLYNSLGGLLDSSLSLSPHEVVSYFTADGTWTLVVNSAAGSGTYWLDVSGVRFATPELTVRNASIKEGDSGDKTVGVPVEMNTVSDQPVTVKYETVDGSAEAGAKRDYADREGTLTIPSGRRSGKIKVPVHGDKRDEKKERFKVKLSGPTNASILDGVGIVTIKDNDPKPKLRIKNAEKKEGTPKTTALAKRSKTKFKFTVKLSRKSEKKVVVKYKTIPKSAQKGEDFKKKKGKIKIKPGTKKGKITVKVFRDAKPEPDEKFLVKIKKAKNAKVKSRKGQGIIRNDD